tara:strand:+ start:11740 stop:12807 length:1068 start_codon:yes stop_codon:yes gene_type:complete
MKKLPKFRRKKQVDPEGHSARITNETVAEHRKRVLAGGRRFKYPVQYARHRLVINAIIIAIIALITLAGVIWWQLYPLQNSSTFFYRITKAVPLPVASVDGYPVRYSDYLVSFRAIEHYKQHKEGVSLRSGDYKEQLEYYRRESLNGAIADAYAEKIAKERNITVSEEQINEALDDQRASRDGVTSQETYDAIVLDHYNWTPAEAREVTAASLLRQEVAYAIDDLARTQRDLVVKKLNANSDFSKVAQSIPPQGDAQVTSGVVPLVPRNNQDGGLASMAARLSDNEISDPFRSTTGDGYYIVKQLEKDGDRVSYAYIKIPLTVFDRQLKELQRNDKIKEYIDVSTSTVARLEVKE